MWGIVLLVPIIETAYDYQTGFTEEFEWKYVASSYITYSFFLVIFLLCKLIFEPRLFFNGRPYMFFLVSFLTAFILILLSGYFVPKRLHRDRPRPVREQQVVTQGAVQPADSLRFGEAFPPESRHPDDPGMFPRPDEASDPEMGPPPGRIDDGGPGARMHEPRVGLKHFIRGPFLPKLMMALLMIGSSLAVAVFFRARQDRLKFKELQAAQLQSELDYLKYQINPHFFMNTLNNIHALVDIDSELAKEAIISLSRLMRYVLYESNQSTVPLRKELSFIAQYIELMKIRTDDSVTLTYEEPEAPCNSCLDAGIPPMLLISFIENAFKHGISHREPSFIDIKVKCEDDRFHFHCANSNFSRDTMKAQQGGVGLDNVRKRLEIIYPGRYTLNIVPTEKEFTVDLWLPIT